MIVSLTAMSLAKIVTGSWLAGGVMGGSGVKLYDALKAARKLEQKKQLELANGKAVIASPAQAVRINAPDGNYIINKI